ncbi:MAG: hypothetical protein ABIY70_01810 [Capsulimonas sp.]|uniref:hypothetical protein n=1 Tax=Capsulimonas sp. TaxID=2494211 RepID=UPI00326711F7
MQNTDDNSIHDDPTMFLAGHLAPRGVYLLVGTQREVRLDQEDILPATLDGQVAVYERLTQTWANLRDQNDSV